VETPGAEAVDETPSEEAADATPGAETADATPGEEAADATPGEEAVDETPGEEAADATPGAATADETPGAEAVDETPEAAAPPIEKTRGWKDRLRGIFSRGEGAVPVDRQEEFARFAIFWMLLSLAAYAYIGEKVPWLILHQLLPMIFVAVYAMTTKKAVVVVAASILLVAMTFHAAFTPADINEPIVQVQNSEDLQEVFAMIDAAEHVAIATDNYWPLPWYYRGENASKLAYFSKKVSEQTIYGGDYDLVITHDGDTYPTLEGYTKATYKLNYWFSYDENKDRLPEYYFLRDGKTGSRNIEVFSKVPTGTTA